VAAKTGSPAAAGNCIGLSQAAAAMAFAKQIFVTHKKKRGAGRRAAFAAWGGQS
jgi:hypothetical protein